MRCFLELVLKRSDRIVNFVHEKKAKLSQRSLRFDSAFCFGAKHL